MNSTLENLREYFILLNDEELKRVLTLTRIEELCEIWGDLSEDEERKIFHLLDLDKKVALITELAPVEQERIIRSLPVENTRLLFDEMEPDDLADIIQAVSPEAREAVWSTLSPEAQQEMQFLLRFDEDAAAGLMTPRYVAVRATTTIGQALAFIRKSARDVETVYYIYVVDNLKRLQGVISLRDMLFAPDTTPVGQVMVSDVIAVHEDTDQEEAARTLEMYDLIALPVVDRHNRLLGIITFDDVIDVIHEEQTEDVYRMGAVSGTPERYIDTSIWGLIGKRIPWLVVLLLTGTITTNLLRGYESLVFGAAFLTLFIPVITQTGGNTGTQSSTLMIRGIATGELHLRDFRTVLVKELLVGLLMGLALGVIITLRSVLLPPGITWFEGLTVGFALTFVVLFSTLIGALAPLLIHRLGLDPTVMAGPLMATVIDVIGLTIYFEIAKLVLNL